MPSREKPSIENFDEEQQFPILPGMASARHRVSPYYERGLANKPQHLCRYLRIFAVLQISYGGFSLISLIYSVPLLGFSVGSVFTLAFAVIYFKSGFDIFAFKKSGITLGWISTTFLWLGFIYFAYLAREVHNFDSSLTSVVNYFFFTSFLSLFQAIGNTFLLTIRETKENVRLYLR